MSAIRYGSFACSLCIRPIFLSQRQYCTTMAVLYNNCFYLFSFIFLFRQDYAFQRPIFSYIYFLFSRLSLTLSCPMDLRHYPFDEQRCSISMESCMYQLVPKLRVMCIQTLDTIPERKITSLRLWYNTLYFTVIS